MAGTKGFVERCQAVPDGTTSVFTLKPLPSSLSLLPFLSSLPPFPSSLGFLPSLLQLCDTYSCHLYVPACADSATIQGSAKFRSKGRLPILSYYYAPKEVRERARERGRREEGFCHGDPVFSLL